MTSEQTLFGVLISGLLMTAYAVLPEPLVNELQAVPVVVYLGILAAAIQAFAYVLYIRNDDIDPNPTTWFMFAYGTTILVFLEGDSEATSPELILPIVCSFFCVYVTYKCWKKARKADPSRFWPVGWWPDDYLERWSFGSDIFITVGYVMAWVLKEASILPLEYKDWAVLTFLFLSNVSTFIQFYPILHETYLHPERENWKPWFVWALAYGTLALVTYLTHNEVWHHLMFYPLSSCFLHLLMAWLARPGRQTV